jgi:membrane protein
MAFFRGTWAVIAGIWNGYFDDRIPRLAAALSYYTVFSAAPLLVIAIAVAGLIFGDENARGQISAQIEGLVGQTGADALRSMVQSASRHRSGLAASLLAVGVILFGATGVFSELQDSLNTIWGVKPKPGHGIWLFVRTRLLSFTMVFGVGFLLLVSLLLSALLAGVAAWLAHQWPGISEAVDITNVLVLFVLTTLLFAMIFKLLPDVRLRWSDVWIGAAATAALFGVGRWAIGLYLGHGAVASSYGAAASLAVFLLWVYFSAQAFLIGAEFTKVFARTYGSHVEPKAVAEWRQTGSSLGPPARPGHPGTSGLAPG